MFFLILFFLSILFKDSSSTRHIYHTFSRFIKLNYSFLLYLNAFINIVIELWDKHGAYEITYILFKSSIHKIIKTLKNFNWKKFHKENRDFQTLWLSNSPCGILILSVITFFFRLLLYHNNNIHLSLSIY